MTESELKVWALAHSPTMPQAVRVLELLEQRDKLLAFKGYCHARLDAAGVPVDPDSPHKAEGCRVGGRLDWLIGERDMLRAVLEPFALLATDNPDTPDGVPIRFWSNTEPITPAVPPTMADCRRAATLFDPATVGTEYVSPQRRIEELEAERDAARRAAEGLAARVAEQSALLTRAAESAAAAPDRFGVLEQRLAEWHLRSYGAVVNGPRTFAKVVEEVGELAEALNEGDADAAATEAADVVVVLVHLVRGLNRSLGAALLAKVKVIEERLTNPAAGRKGVA